ncbi:MAG: hypothetical protein O2783_05800 [Chloroflexi bacterium]|nr:hypothetical protein [Chloroflexota bacterium]
MNIGRYVVMALSFMLLLGACSSSLSPEEVVDLFLSETGQQGMETALLRWELSEVGTESFTLDLEQQKVRMEGRRMLAVELTEALVIAEPRLSWEQGEASYYALRNGVPLITDSRNEADLATIEMKLVIEGSGKAALEESLAFNLWRNPEGGWRITGLDKGLSMLGPFLEEMRAGRDLQ